MDEEELNVAGLSQGQLEALQQYALVTNQEAGAAIPLLQKCEWNVQVSAARHQGVQRTTDMPFTRLQ